MTEQETLETYGYSPNSYHHAAPHSVVITVFSTEDVVKVVNTARKWRMPITAYSGGTSLEGHFGGASIRLLGELSLTFFIV
jgi:D-lactate dehydrogenase (cytochrome)